MFPNLMHVLTRLHVFGHCHPNSTENYVDLFNLHSLEELDVYVATEVVNLSHLPNLRNVEFDCCNHAEGSFYPETRLQSLSIITISENLSSL
ncbi:hypothetical protein RCL1_000606 [Eukaryota sp. TZLM3-RCL]